ncbi:MAG: S8 family serine peptidase [Lachnospiraceae bacterium]|nr:S8 family serine peptidase [Lachnospiraceae bacterium]
MGKFKINLLSRIISKTLILVMVLTSINCDFYVDVFAMEEISTATFQTETETLWQMDGEIFSDNLNSLNDNVDNGNQERIDSSLWRDDPLAGETIRNNTCDEEETTIDDRYTQKTSNNILAVEQNSTLQVTDNYDEQTDFEPGIVIVGFKRSYSKTKIKKEFPKIDIESVEDQDEKLYNAVNSTKKYDNNTLISLEEKIGRDYVIRLNNTDRESVINAVNQIKKSGDVEYVSPNYYVEPNVIPNDTSYSQLWGMDKIQAPQAWNSFTGSNTINVGVLDTGIDTTHTDLASNINMQLAYNAYTETPGNVTDNFGHGTHVSGTIGAVGNNQYGVTGINWNVKIVPIKICSSTSSNSSYVHMTNAILYAIEKEIPICNLSYSTPDAQIFRNAIQQYNGLLIMSAGNDGKDIDTIDKYSAMNALGNVIYVASSKSDDTLSSFSNYGVKNVHIAAPGQDIYSTVPTGNGSFGIKSGTSMAAPHVTGAVALIKGKYPNLSMAEIKDILLSSVDYPMGIRGFVSAGRLNLYKAINMTSDSTSLTVQPYDDEELSDAITRSLGTKNAADITYLKLIGNANMNSTGDAQSSANYILPNLEYADLSLFTGFLGDRAFANCSNLQTVIFPTNEFALRACTFWYCSSLNTIYKANDRKRIYGEADLSGVIAASSSGQPYSIRVQCFQGCSSLATIKIPNTHKLKLSIYVFNKCSNLSTIYIDGYPKVTGVADLTEFEDVSQGMLQGTKINKVLLPKDVAVSSNSFKNCSYLTYVQIHPNQTIRPTIGENAFNNVNTSCKVYVNQFVRECEPRVIIPRNTSENLPILVNSLVIQPITNETIEDSIEWYLDERNPEDINHIVIKGSAILAYGGSANILPNLETVDLSEFTGDTEKGAFGGCDNLVRVVFSASNTSIPAWTFLNCSSLQAVQIASKYPKLWSIDLSNLTGSLALNTQAFYHCSSIESVILPYANSIGLGQYTFTGCTNLLTVYKDGNEKIDGRADLSGISNFWSGRNFKNTSIIELSLPLGIDISTETFMDCTELRKILFNPYQTNTVNIGTQAFYNVNSTCSAYMNIVLVNDSTFVLPRTVTQYIPKFAY